MSNEMEQDWIILMDEDGQEYRYSLERLLEVEDRKYVILVPEIQENEDEEEAHVFRLDTDEEGEEILVDVEDEELKEVQDLLEEEEMEEEEEEGEEGEEEQEEH